MSASAELRESLRQMIAVLQAERQALAGLLLVYRHDIGHKYGFDHDKRHQEVDIQAHPMIYQEYPTSPVRCH